MTLYLFAFIFVLNPWLLTLAKANFFVALIAVFASIVLLFVIKERKGKVLFYVLFMLLLFFQWKMTNKISLTNLDNDQQHIQKTRMNNEYPLVRFTFLRKTIWPPIPHWFEERKESVAFFRIQKNAGEVLDINLYFFANHPRERVGVKEFEKMLYVFLPFFLFGLVQVIKTKLGPEYVLSVILPIILTSVIGQKNPAGPFSFIPFFFATLHIGLETAYLYVKKWRWKTPLVYMFLTLVILTFLQAYTYEKY